MFPIKLKTNNALKILIKNTKTLTSSTTLPTIKKTIVKLKTNNLIKMSKENNNLNLCKLNEYEMNESCKYVCFLLI